MSPKPLRAANLDALDGISHGFFTREGGVSEGLFAGLNCGYGSKDERHLVQENRHRVARHLGLADEERLTSLYQVHSADAVPAQSPWPGGEAPKADAMVTDRSDLALGILTADCTPVLFADARAGVVGAAHAGWKGALEGVLENCIAKMVQQGARAENIHAAVGPTIHQASYEVSADYRQGFLQRDPAHARHFLTGERDGHYQFDLPGFVMEILTRQDLASVENLGRDTYSEPELFYSYRRTTHRKEADYGRLIAAIRLT